MPNKKTYEETIKVPHHRSNQFTSHFATGVILSGETPDGMNHLIFYSDVVGINSETGTKVKGTESSYTTIVGDGDLDSFREDKSRISMSTETLERLYGILKKRFGDDKTKDAEPSVESDKT